uniref:Uncharacterized protein n=1 Tax=Ceratitis capitata TaxID=7213 RepID=W8AQV9_CERCA
MYNKRDKCSSYKSKRCNKGVSNNGKNIAISTCTWAFNLLAVALLIQHVVCVAAQAREYVTVTAATAAAAVDKKSKTGITVCFALIQCECCIADGIVAACE